MEIGVRNRETNKLYNKVYQLWYNMNKRCHNEKSPYYKNYGAKGVVVCKEWRSLDGFIQDFYKIKGFNLDAFMCGVLYLDKDTKDMDNKTYCLEKCEFISIQDSNKIKPNQQVKFIAKSPKGEIFEAYNQSEFAKKHGLLQGAISSCIRGEYKNHRGWCFVKK